MSPALHHRHGNLSGPLLALVVGILVLAGWLTWFILSKTPLPSPNNGSTNNTQVEQPDQFVGSSSCAECHADIYKSYQHHPMANSLSLPADATVSEDYQQHTSFISGGRRYRVTLPKNPEAADNKKPVPRHHEKMIDADNDDIYDQSFPIAFVVGSGSRGRSYIIQHDQLLFQSPITWYVKDQTWDLSPGYDPSGHQRFGRRLSESCLSCHAGKSNFVGNHNDRFDSVTPFHELTIGCERCHGPGGQHAQAHRQGLISDSQNIVNPEKLAPRERNSVCYQCHLSGKHRVLRYGKRPRDFRPGQSLRDIWTVFISGTGIDQDQQARLTSNVEQMHSSRCFQQSDGKMGCISCHDAHSHPKPAERTAYYRARCLSCHQQDSCSLPEAEQSAAPALNSCTHCHMPKLVTSDIAHSSQADHRILRFPATTVADPEKSKPTMTDKNGPRWTVFDGGLETIPGWDADRATAIASFHEARASNDEDAMRTARDKLLKVVNQVPEDQAARLELAQIYYRLENYPEALKHIQITLTQDPQQEAALVLAAFSAQLTDQFQDGIDYFAQKIAQNPWDANLFIPYAEMIAEQQDLHKAIKVLKDGLQIDPSSIALHSVIAEYYRRTGQIQERQRHLDLIESIRYSMERDQ
jgi:hypothetical protein